MRIDNRSDEKKKKDRKKKPIFLAKFAKNGCVKNALIIM